MEKDITKIGGKRDVCHAINFGDINTEMSFICDNNLFVYLYKYYRLH